MPRIVTTTDQAPSRALARRWPPRRTAIAGTSVDVADQPVKAGSAATAGAAVVDVVGGNVIGTVVVTA